MLVEYWPTRSWKIRTMYARNDNVFICAAVKSTYTSLLNEVAFLAPVNVKFFFWDHSLKFVSQRPKGKYSSQTQNDYRVCLVFCGIFGPGCSIAIEVLNCYTSWNKGVPAKFWEPEWPAPKDANISLEGGTTWLWFIMICKIGKMKWSNLEKLTKNC